MRPTATVIVVAYNSQRIIDACMAALIGQDYPEDRFQIVVVDNASTDATDTILRTRYPQVNLYVRPSNEGFARANNFVLRQTTDDYAALVNPDAALDSHWLSAAVDCLEQLPDAAVVGSKVFYGNGQILQHTGGRIEANALTSHIGDGELDIGQYDEVCDVDYVNGAALLLRTSVARELDYLDESYFLYFEETDFCVRARQAGYRIVYCPDAVTLHFEHASFSSSPSVRYLLRYHTSRLIFVRKNFTAQMIWQRFFPAEYDWLRFRTDRRNRVILCLLYMRSLFSWLPLVINPYALRNSEKMPPAQV